MSVKGKKGSSEVTKIITDIPSDITAEFLASHHVGEYRELVQNDIRENGYSIEWSLKTSQSIEAGADEASRESNGHAGSSNEPVDHCFDREVEDLYRAGFDQDAEALARKPAASPAPLSDGDLQGIPGTALLPQRKFLRDKLRRKDLALKIGLSREDATKYIIELQKAAR